MKNIRWNWGTSVAVVYIAFASATVAFVIFAIAHPATLVSADYYTQALGHDRRIEAAANVRSLETPAELMLESTKRPSTPDDHTARGLVAVLTLPARHHATAAGTVTWYRASDASSDRVVRLAIDADGVQRMPIDDLRPGRWRVKVEWTAEDRPFYFERLVTIAP